MTPDYKRYLGLPSAAELKIALKYMSKDVLSGSLEQQIKSIGVMMKRSKVVGNLPRYLLTEKAYKVRQTRAESACTHLDDAAIQKVLEWDGIVDSNQTYAEISGCIFSINAASESSDVGYDGASGIDYGYQRLAIMSKAILDKVVGTNREKILSFWAVVGSGERSCMGSKVEELCWQELKKNSLAHVREMSFYGNTKIPVSPFRPGENVAALTGLTIPDLNNIFSADNILGRMMKGTDLIDFAGPGLKVYQATISDTHDMVPKGLQELLITSGHCVKVNDRLELVENIADLQKIKFYWMIPYQKKTQWLKKQPLTKNKDKNKDPTLKFILNQCVEQFVFIVGGENFINQPRTVEEGDLEEEEDAEEDTEEDAEEGILEDHEEEGGLDDVKEPVVEGCTKDVDEGPDSKRRKT